MKRSASKAIKKPKLKPLFEDQVFLIEAIKGIIAEAKNSELQLFATARKFKRKKV